MEDKKVLIVGGGIEGVSAALEKAEEGAKVTIVEKFPTLGAEILIWKKCAMMTMSAS